MNYPTAADGVSIPCYTRPTTATKKPETNAKLPYIYRFPFSGEWHFVAMLRRINPKRN